MGANEYRAVCAVQLLVIGASPFYSAFNPIRVYLRPI
jgi:hypothetical protein